MLSNTFLAKQGLGQWIAASASGQDIFLSKV